MKIIIARYNEDISWSKGLDRFVVQKGEHLPNTGREPSSYMWYIINYYDQLEGNYIFTQADPFYHYRDFGKFMKKETSEFEWVSDMVELRCDSNGSPHDVNLEIDTFLANCGLEKQDYYTFSSGCIFSISAEQIKKNPKEYYERVLNALSMTKKAPWAFERVIDIIFKVKQ